jgi:cell division septum initiation protein DivIVA
MTEPTPITQIENRALPIARKGYERTATDKLLDELKASLTTLVSERNAAQARVKEFESRVAALEEREKEITGALVMASRVREQSEQEGKARAEEKIRAAEVEAERIVADARSSARRFEQEARDAELLAVRARQQLTSYLESLLAEIERGGDDLGSVVEELVTPAGEAGDGAGDTVEGLTSRLPRRGEAAPTKRPST